MSKEAIMECFEVLKKSEIFDGLSDEEIQQIEDISEMVDCQPGSIIYKEDEEPNKIYIVARGMVTIWIDVGLKGQLYVATVTQGEVVGWSVLLPPYRHTAGAKCMDAATLVSVGRP